MVPTDTPSAAPLQADTPAGQALAPLSPAAVLARVDAGRETLGRIVTYGPGDLLSYAPVTRKALEAGGGTGRMSVADLCAATLVWSDNAAANLLLADLGGPAALTAWLRTTGDPVTRLDRTEPTLNTALPGWRITPGDYRITVARDDPDRQVGPGRRHGWYGQTLRENIADEDRHCRRSRVHRARTRRVARWRWT